MGNMKKIIANRVDSINDSGVDNSFSKVIAFLRKDVYPKLGEDDLYELNTKLKKWFTDNT